jgi:hypothetical protein
MLRSTLALGSLFGAAMLLACAAKAPATPDPFEATSAAKPRAERSPGPSLSRRASTLFPADAVLAGNVALAQEALLYPTAERALADRKTGSMSLPPRTHFAIYPVLEASPGTAKVRTLEDRRDCAAAASRDPDAPVYAIEAYVARDSLVARLARATVVEHADGTGARAIQGALLRIREDGSGEPLDEGLAPIGVIPRDSIALATPSGGANDGAVFARTLDPLVCDPDPQTEAAWRAKAPKEPPPPREPDMRDEPEYRICINDVLTRSSFGNVSTKLCEEQYRARHPSPRPNRFALPLPPPLMPSYCQVFIPGLTSPLVTKLDGKPFLSVATLSNTTSSVGTATHAGVYLAQVARVCGSVRVEVPAEVVKYPGASGRGRLGLERDVSWARERAAVTWPDGSRAGTIATTGPIPNGELSPASDDRMCTKVDRFAEPLCLAKSDLCATRSCPSTTK